MHKFDLNNKTAIITGGAQGFGLDIAKRFLDSGAKAIIWDIDEKELIKASKEVNNPNLTYNVVDVSNFNEVHKAIDQIAKSSKIDILINNAGITGPISPIQDLDPADLKLLIDTNVSGAFFVAQETARIMINQK